MYHHCPIAFDGFLCGTISKGQMPDGSLNNNNSVVVDLKPWNVHCIWFLFHAPHAPDAQHTWTKQRHAHICWIVHTRHFLSEGQHNASVAMKHMGRVSPNNKLTVEHFLNANVLSLVSTSLKCYRPIGAHICLVIVHIFLYACICKYRTIGRKWSCTFVHTIRSLRLALGGKTRRIGRKRFVDSIILVAPSIAQREEAVKNYLSR